MAQQDVSMLSPGEQAVDENLDKFDSALDSLEAAARPFLQADMAAVAEQLGPIDRAKLRVALAYATTSVYFMYLKMNGVNTMEHPVKEELDRVKAYFGKVSRAEKAIEREQGKQSSNLNLPAAKRFIKSALDTKTSEQASPGAGAPAAATGRSTGKRSSSKAPKQDSRAGAHGNKKRRKGSRSRKS